MIVVAICAVTGCRVAVTDMPTADGDSPAVTGTAAAGGASKQRVTVPSVGGKRLSDAQDILGAAGFDQVDVKDGTGQGRIVMDPDNWIVASQSPKAGAQSAPDATIVLAVGKPTDDQGPASITKGAVPDVVCMSLQSAQDTMQSANFYNLRSEDGLGKGRTQLLDRDWVVTKQSARAGSRPGWTTRIMLTAVKYGESTGSSGCKS